VHLAVNYAPLKVLLAAAVTTLAAGCRTVDVASRHSGAAPQCEVHGTVMAPEFIRVSPGETVYLRDYEQIAQTRFPHHGGVILNGESEFTYPFVRRIRDFVCPDCTAAYDEFWRSPRFRTSQRGGPRARGPTTRPSEHGHRARVTIHARRGPSR